MNKEQVKQLRKKLGWTQQRLADYLDVRVTTVHRYEAGLREPRGPVRKLLRMLDKEAA